MNLCILWVQGAYFNFFYFACLKIQRFLARKYIIQNTHSMFLMIMQSKHSEGFYEEYFEIFYLKCFLTEGYKHFYYQTNPV